MRAIAIVSAALLCLVATASAGAWNIKYADGPDPAVARWPSWPHPVSCEGTSFDPVATFAGPTEAENGSGGPEQALKKYLDEGLYPQVPTRFWRPVVTAPTQAIFASGRLAQGLFWLSTELVDGQWRISGNPDECSARTVRDGNVAIDWSMPGGQGLDAASRTIAVSLHERAGCDGGRSHNKAAEPEFRQVGKKLLLTIWLKPLPPGAYTCEKRVEGPLVLKLSRPLGDRQLWDGGGYPPHRER